MSDNKIDIDGVRFKVEADLSKLDQDLKKGETNAKKGGENLGQAAGKGFDAGLKENVKKTLDDVKKESDGASSSLMGIFGKVGGAIAGAFALDKVVGFFKDSMKYASDIQEQMGGVSESTKNINEDFDKLTKNGAGFWNSIKLAVGNALNTIITGLKSLALAAVDAFRMKNADEITEGYQRFKKEVINIGAEIDRLNTTNKKTAEQELELIKLKDQLSEKAKKLGLNYNELAANSKNYLDIAEKIAKAEKARAREQINELGRGLQGGLQGLESQKRDASSALRDAVSRGDRERIVAIREQIAELNVAIKNQKQAIADTLNRRNNMDQPLQGKTEEGKGSPSVRAEDKGNEARFLDSALRLKTIQTDLEYTIRKAEQAASRSKNPISEEEKNRRINMAEEEARQATEYELSSLRQGYAQFIEDTHTAKMEAIKSEADNARRLSNNLLEAELAQAEDNEELIQKAKEANAKRQAEIDKAEAIKLATQYAQSFQQTMQAAQATTTGIVQLTKAKDIGSSLSAQGNVLQGMSGFKDLAPSLGVLGPIGAGFGALGGIFTSIFGDSEAKAAERARQQAERDAAALKTLQSQEKYQKDLLEFQKAQANLPFKDLQRELRVIDLQTQQKRLSGMPADQAEAERLQRTSGAISGVLQSEADKFTGGVFFKNSARSPEALSAALGDVDKYGPSMNLLSSIMSEVAATRGESAEKIGFDFYNQRLSKVQSLDLPPELKQAASDFIVSVAAAGFYRNARDGGINTENDYMLSQARVPGYSKYAGDIYNIARSYESMLGGRGINTSTSNVDNLISEFQADAGMIENLFGLFEKLNQTNLQIQENTGKTASNTEKLVETPTRSSSLIDITRGFTRSLGQNMLPSSLPMGLPDSVHSAALAIDIQKSLEERSLNKLEDLVSINRDQREFLAIISKSLVAGSSADAMTRMQLEDLYRRSIGGIAA